MNFLKCCVCICVVLDMLVLINIFGPSTTYIQTHEVYEVVHAYLCTLKCASVKRNIWHMVTLKNPNPNRYAHSQWIHMKILKCCGRICVVLDMLVLIPIFGTSTPHIPSGHT